jgi:hypothetical protein
MWTERIAVWHRSLRSGRLCSCPLQKNIQAQRWYYRVSTLLIPIIWHLIDSNIIKVDLTRKISSRANSKCFSFRDFLLIKKKNRARKSVWMAVWVRRPKFSSRDSLIRIIRQVKMEKLLPSLPWLSNCCPEEPFLSSISSCLSLTMTRVRTLNTLSAETKAYLK